jgi:molybdate transport system regulatory protein
MRHARGPAKLRLMFGPEIAIGPGKADLLDAIAATGSISESARRMGMSYRRAWLLVDTMNRCFREPVVAAATGGSGGGGATLTPFGRRALAQFRAMQARVDRALKGDLDKFSDLLADRPR